MPRRNHTSRRQQNRGPCSRRFETAIRNLPHCKRSGKVRYRDRRQAVDALQVIQAQRPDGHHECRVYRCPHCRGWHLTSQPLQPKTPTRVQEVAA